MEDKIPQLVPRRLIEGDYSRNTWRATVEISHTRDHLKDPTFWSHAAQRLKVYDKIEVIRDDGQFYAEYLVLSIGRGWAKVYELCFHTLTTKDVEQTQAAQQDEEYEVAWKGPHLKWCVVRKQDSERIKEEAQSKDEASLWLKEYLKTTA